MANRHEARLARLEQQRGGGFDVVLIGRDDVGRYCITVDGRAWIAEVSESEQDFATRVQHAVGSGHIVMTRADSRL